MYLVVVFCIEQLFKMSIGAVDFSSLEKMYFLLSCSSEQAF